MGGSRADYKYRATSHASDVPQDTVLTAGTYVSVVVSRGPRGCPASPGPVVSRGVRMRHGGRQRRAKGLSAKLSEGYQQAADDREWLAVLLADPLSLVAGLDEPRDGVAEGRQPGGAQHHGPYPGLWVLVGELVGEGRQLAELEH